MNSIVGLVLFALVSSTVVAADDDFNQLYNRLFAQDAEVLERQQVVELLEKIRPLVKTESSDINEIVREDVDALLSANTPKLSRCESYDRFGKSYRNLSRRDIWKGDNAESWNKNIKNYIDACEREQYDVCLRQFKKNMSQVPARDVKLVEEVMAELESGPILPHEVSKAILATIEPKLQQKSPNKISRTNFGLKSKVEAQFKELYDNLIDACEEISSASEDEWDMIVNTVHRMNDNIVVDGETKAWIRKILTSNKILDIARPKRGEPLYDRMKDKVLAKY